MRPCYTLLNLAIYPPYKPINKRWNAANPSWRSTAELLASPAAADGPTCRAILTDLSRTLPDHVAFCRRQAPGQVSLQRAATCGDDLIHLIVHICAMCLTSISAMAGEHRLLLSDIWT